MRRFVVLGLAAASLLSAGPLVAQRLGVVLSLPASARAVGISDAAAFAPGANALFYGAQELPRERAAAASAGTWIGGVQFATLAASLPVTRRVALGFGVQSLDYGSADEIVPDPLTGGTRGVATGDRVAANEIAATVGASVVISRGPRKSRGARFGYSLGLLRQQVADVSTTSWTYGLGFSQAAYGWTFRTSTLQGLSASRGASSQRIGMGMRASLTSPGWMVANGVVHGVTEFRSSTQDGRTVVAGGEYEWSPATGWQLALRAAGASYSATTARAPWSLGGSAARGAWSLDYGYQGFGALGAVHRMGVTWRSRGVRNPSP